MYVGGEEEAMTAETRPGEAIAAIGGYAADDVAPSSAGISAGPPSCGVSALDSASASDMTTDWRCVCASAGGKDARDGSGGGWSSAVFCSSVIGCSPSVVVRFLAGLSYTTGADTGAGT